MRLLYMEKKYNKKYIENNVNLSSSVCRFCWRNGKQMLLALALCLSPMSTFAQKISLGSCITRDGGQYKGEMVAERLRVRVPLSIPTVIPTRALIRKVSAKDMAYILSLTVKSMKASGCRISSMARVLSIFRITTSM